MIGKKIAALRKSRGLTQTKFADAIHVTQGAVSQWETGRTIPDIQQMYILADFFGISVDELSGHVPAESAPQPLPKKPDTIAEYLSQLNPENRAFIVEMARKLLASQEKK